MDPKQTLLRLKENANTAYDRKPIQDALDSLEKWEQGISGYPPDLSVYGISKEDVLALQTNKQSKADNGLLIQQNGIQNGSSPITNDNIQQSEAHNKIIHYLESVKGDLSLKDDDFIIRRIEMFNRLPQDDWFDNLDKQDVTQFQNHLNKLNKEKQQRIDQLFIEADKADNINKESLYLRIINLDKKNQTAKVRIEGLHTEEENKKVREKILNYISRLTSIRQIQDLQKVIDELETLQSVGKFPSKLEKPLFEAKNRLEDLKAEAGIISSKIHFGNLSQKYEAIEDLQNSRLSTFSNQITGENEPISQALKKANEAWKDQSREAMNKIINHGTIYKNHDPLLSLEYFGLNIGEPGDQNKKLKIYHEDDKHKYEQQYNEIKKSAQNQQEAIHLVTKADNESDPFDKYKLLISASMKFINLEGLSEQILTTRERAIESLLNKVDFLLQQAMDAAGLRDFDHDHGAQYWIRQSYAKINEWPEDQADLKDKKREIDNHRNKINTSASVYNKLILKENQIEQLTKSKKTVQRAFDEFEQIKGNIEYQSEFSDILSRIQSSLDLLRGADEQIKLIQKHLQDQKRPDWKYISSLSQKILTQSSGEGTAQYQQAEEYLHNAKAELLIQDILDEIKQENIKKARELIEDLRKIYPEYLDRVANEEKIVKEAEDSTPDFEIFFRKARNDENSKKIEIRDNALELFKYLAGYQSSLSAQPDIPVYKLSKYTYDSKNAVIRMENRIRDDFELLQKAKLSNIRTNLKDLAERAKSIINLKLNYIDEETALCEWTEITYTEFIAELNSQNGKWEENIMLWGEIKSRYPVIGDVKEKDAIVQSVIQKAKNLIDEGKYDKAIQDLLVYRDDFITVASDFKIILSEAYEKANQLVKAYEIVNFRSDNEKIINRKKEIEIIIGLQNIKEKIQPHKENFIKASNVAIGDTQLGKQIQVLSEEANTIRSIYVKFFNENDELYKDDKLIQLFNSEKHEIDKKISEIISILWNNHQDETDFLALLLSLIKHDFASKQQISLIDLCGYVNENDESRILKAIRGSVGIIQNNIANFNCINQTIDSALQNSELLFGQHSNVLKLVNNINTGIAISALENDGQTNARIRYSLLQAQRSHKVLSIVTNTNDNVWKIATEQIIELPIKEHIKNLENIPYISDTVEAKTNIRKFIEWRILIEYFNGVKDNLKNLLLIEKWSALIKQVDTLKKYNRMVTNTSDPLLIQAVNQCSKHLPFEFCLITITDYENYLKWYSKNVEVRLNEKDVIGWEDIKNLAKNCLENVEKWEKWGVELEKLMIYCQNLSFLIEEISKEMPWNIPNINNPTWEQTLPYFITKLINYCSAGYSEWVTRDPQRITISSNEEINTRVTKFEGKLPLRYRIWILTGYNSLITRTIKYYTDGPEENGVEKFSVLSNGAETIKITSMKNITLVINWQTQIKDKITDFSNEIDNRGGFVYDAEIKNLKKDNNFKEKRIKDCEAIGPETKDEWDRYNLLKITTIQPPPPPPYWLRVIEWIKEQFKLT